VLSADGWWKLFGDDELDRHVDATLAANQDLAVAIARYDESSALLGFAQAAQLPSAKLGTAFGRARTSGTVTDPFPVLLGNYYEVPATFSYEVDFWGRVRHSVALAQASMQAEAYSVSNLRLALAAQATAAYIKLRAEDRDIAVLIDTVKLRQQALDLTNERARIGNIGDLDVARARAQLAETQADLKDATRTREDTVHALAVLENKSATSLDIETSTNLPKIPTVPPGLPASLLQRRPDIAEQEQQLVAANERIGVAITSFFPSISLTAAGGVASEQLDLLTNKNSEDWSFGPKIDLALFDGGRNRSNFAAAQAAYREALGAYRKTILVAFQESQDALTDAHYLSERAVDLKNATSASIQAARISRSRYDRGLVSYFEVVDSEREALNNQRAEIQNDELELIASVSLIKALGGGWDRTAPVPRRPVEQAPGELPWMPTVLPIP
jgi:multidrug efflux system outer membrane protein